MVSQVRPNEAIILASYAQIAYSKKCMADAPMTVVETERFLKDVRPLLSDAGRAELVAFIGTNPEAGAVIPETGGVRKVRWANACRCSCWQPIRRARRQT